MDDEMNARERALVEYNEVYKVYKEGHKSAHFWYSFFKILALISIAGAPAIVIALPSDWAGSKWIGAVASAIGGVCSSLLLQFDWHGTWIRHANAGAELEAERRSFMSNTEPDAVAHFIQRINEINRDERLNWVGVEDLLRNPVGNKKKSDSATSIEG
jgi:Protein of unknown function (DUF4231)